MHWNLVVPDLGESVIEATVGAWRKVEGDLIRVGDVVVELETDKVNLEVGATHDGTLSRIERKEGETVRIGDVLGLIAETETPGTKAVVSEKKQPPAGEKAASPQGLPRPSTPVPARHPATPSAPAVALEKRGTCR